MRELLEISIIWMFQKQQAMLQGVLEGQKALEERQDTVESHLAELQSKMEESATSTPSSSDGKRKRVVTRTLSVSCNKMYHFYAPLRKRYTINSAKKFLHGETFDPCSHRWNCYPTNCLLVVPHIKPAYGRMMEKNLVCWIFLQCMSIMLGATKKNLSNDNIWQYGSCVNLKD